jgi:hypothetical protein
MTNQQVDGRGLEILREGPMAFSVIKSKGEVGYEDRQLDRRLQALRRKGVIRFSHKTGWELVTGPAK